MTFVRDMVEGMLTITVQINHNFWGPHDRRIVLETTAATSLLVLTSTANKLPDATPTKEEASLCLVSLAVMKLVYPLLKPPLLSSTTTYSFIEARAAALNPIEAVQPLLTWIQGYFVDVAP